MGLPQKWFRAILFVFNDIIAHKFEVLLISLLSEWLGYFFLSKWIKSTKAQNPVRKWQSITPWVVERSAGGFNGLIRFACVPERHQRERWGSADESDQSCWHWGQIKTINKTPLRGCSNKMFKTQPKQRAFYCLIYVDTDERCLCNLTQISNGQLTKGKSMSSRGRDCSSVGRLGGHFSVKKPGNSFKIAL